MSRRRGLDVSVGTVRRAFPGFRPRSLPELPSVNALAGQEPVRPELSGLCLRPPDAPADIERFLISPAYRWQPSPEQARRRVEMRRINLRLRREGTRMAMPPPILGYPGAEVQASRYQPVIKRWMRRRKVRSVAPPGLLSGLR
jgi:hypothetical protein